MSTVSWMHSIHIIYILFFFFYSIIEFMGFFHQVVVAKLYWNRKNISFFHIFTDFFFLSIDSNCIQIGLISQQMPFQSGRFLHKNVKANWFLSAVSSRFKFELHLYRRNLFLNFNCWKPIYFIFFERIHMCISVTCMTCHIHNGESEKNMEKIKLLIKFLSQNVSKNWSLW